jgi:hypothetical protein
MKLHSTEGPDEGSLAVTFRCPECGFRVAMLTNPFETQMVRSLGVKVGGATPPAPFEHVRTMMANPRADAFEGDVAKIGESQAETGTEAGGCPFAAMVNEGAAVTPSSVPWTSEAEARVERIPRSSGPWRAARSSDSRPNTGTRPSTRPSWMKRGARSVCSARRGPVGLPPPGANRN